jgi:hypothetical protein
MMSEEISLQVIDVLNAHSVPYMLVGSLSTNFHSVPRSTKIADIVVQSHLAAAARFLADARNVMAAPAQRLDWPYIERWCDEHGSRPALDRIRAEIGA